MWSLLGMVIEAFGVLGRSRDNVGWWCVGSQSHGSSGYREVQEARQRQGNGLVHLPTISC